jgi:hypothetical protein
MAEWSEDHVAVISSQTQHFGLVDILGQTGDREGHLGGKCRQLVGKVRKWYVASRHLQGCSPHLCRLRIDGLAPMSKY